MIARTAVIGFLTLFICSTSYSETPFTQGDDGKYKSLEDVTCQDMFDTTGSNQFTSALVTVWYNGYLSGKRNQLMMFDDFFVSTVIREVTNRCIENPTIPVFDILNSFEPELTE